jgi:hypothetical protein
MLVANALYSTYRFISSLVSMDGLLTFVIGKQDTAKLNVTGPNPTIIYTVDMKTTQVELVCSNGSTNNFEAFGQGPVETYKFRLTSKSSCWGELV